jgi:hypothetical protein
MMDHAIEETVDSFSLLLSLFLTLVSCDASHPVMMQQDGPATGSPPSLDLQFPELGGTLFLFTMN